MADRAQKVVKSVSWPSKVFSRKEVADGGG